MDIGFRLLFLLESIGFRLLFLLESIGFRLLFLLESQWIKIAVPVGVALDFVCCSCWSCIGIRLLFLLESHGLKLLFLLELHWISFAVPVGVALDFFAVPVGVALDFVCCSCWSCIGFRLRFLLDSRRIVIRNWIKRYIVATITECNGHLLCVHTKLA